MKRKDGKFKAFILIGIFTVITFLDCYLTFLGSPDLSREANPLVSVLGFGWFGLILANVIVLAVYSALVYYSFAVYETPVIIAGSEEELAEKISVTNGKGSFFAMVGFAVGYSMIFSRILLVIDWSTQVFGSGWQFYTNIVRKTPFHRPDLFVAIGLSLIMLVVWFVKEQRALKAKAVIMPQAETAYE